MKIGEVIDSVLINDAAVSAIVGTSVFPLFAKQGAAYPLITWRIDGGTETNETKDGASTLDFVPIEVICFGQTYKVTADLADKVRTALDRYSGTVNGVEIQNIVFYDIENDYVESRNQEFEHFAILDFRMVLKN